MKNKPLIVTLIVFIVLLISFLITFMIKSIGDNSFLMFGKQKMIEEVAHDEEYITNFQTINIDSDTAKINIKESDNNKIKLLIHNKKENTTVDVKEEQLNIKTTIDKCKFICFNPRITQIDLYLPSEYKDKVVIENKVGDVKISNLRYMKLDLKTSTGDIDIDSIESGVLKTSTGDVKIKNIDSLDIETKTGDIDLGTINNKLDIDVKTGDIKIDEANLKVNSSIDTHTGDVKIIKANNIYIDASTKTGDIKINNNDRKIELELKIKTKTGDIRVN